MASSLLIILCGILASSVILSPATSQQNPPNRFQPLPHYWKMILRWPPSHCVSPGVKCLPNYPRNAFVIESIAGFEQLSTVPTTCDVSQQPRLERSKIAIFEKILNQIWPNLEGDNFEMWEKQWQTYASCFGITPEYFFNGAYGFKFDVDRTIVRLGFNGSTYPGEQIYGTLVLQDVVPGKFYLSDTFLNRIYSKYGAFMETYCNSDVSGESQLIHVDFCGTAQAAKFELLPCPLFVSQGCLKFARFT